MSVKTTCPYCGVGCGVLASADGTIKGDPDHPANFGRLCSKGSALGETIDLDGRLLAPQIDGRRASWDEALDLVAEKFAQAVADHGPDSVAFYVSGQLLTEDYYAANKLIKGYLGTANIDTNSRLCMASSVAGHKRAFGSDTVPGTYEDLEDADLIVLVGSNLAWCHPVLFQRIAAEKEVRPNLRVINIDPRRTATTELADSHLSIAPDGDIAVFNGLLAHLAENGHLDTEYLLEHVNGFADAIAAAKKTDPLESGLTEAELEAFYRAWAGTQKVVTVYSQGVNQSRCGTDKVNAILNCHLATGRIGKPGCGPFSVTGQPNAMGGREVGGLANMLANHLDIENEAHREAVQDFWQSPTICDHQGLKAVDLFEACESGQIKALWVMSTNPAVSLPDSDRVANAIANVPFTVVSDILERTDTGDLAHVLLPAAAWGEKSGTVTNSERRISRQRSFLPVPGEARPDWWIISKVAERLGWGAHFAYETAKDVFNEYAALSGSLRSFGRDLDLAGLTELDNEGYDALDPVQWPVPADGISGGRFFADGKFYHADGKAKMLPISAPEPKTGLIFNTGRIRDQWHTMTRTGKSQRLGSHMAEPYVEVHPLDAEALDLKPTHLARIHSDEGEAIFRVLVTDRARRGQLFAPMHWTRQTAMGSQVNAPVQAVTDPVSGQPALKGSRVDAENFPATWYGFLAGTQKIEAISEYCAVARTATGWQAEIAGQTAMDWTKALQKLTGSNDIIAVKDEATERARFAVRKGGIIDALLFIAPDPVVLSRQTAVSLIGTEASPMEALAGVASADRPDQGAVVCSCESVGAVAISAAIAGGATTVDAIGKVTCAGTNCGSCRPELQAMLAKLQTPMAAE